MKTKRNNVAKKLGIASLCLATAISAFSGISSFKKDSVVLAEGSWAEQTTLAATDLVTASAGATVSQDLETTAANAKGLLVSSDVPYEATFNQVFNNNSVFRFRFPESGGGFYGDFRFRIADVNDPNNGFDVIYHVSYAKDKYTGVYVKWENEIRSSTTTSTGVERTNKIPSGQSYRYAPGLRSSGTRGTSLAILSFVWNGDIFRVQSNTTHMSTNANSVLVAQFDGTYDSSISNSNFTGSHTAHALPKLSFPDGYTVSFSSYMADDVTLENGQSATDVVFADVSTEATVTKVSNTKYTKLSYSGGKKFTFNSTSTTSWTANNYTKVAAAMEENAGKKLLGWKDADGALYPTKTALTATDLTIYTPVFLGFNKIPGASLRIDTAGGQSGLRFITGFNVEDNYQDLMAAGYITSYGTLLAYTDALDDRNLTIANYGDNTADEAGQKFLKVPSTQQMFDYTHQGVTYNAYSVALVNPNIKYAQSFTARGYLEVTYSGGATQIFYTNFDARSIEQTAYNLMTLGEAEFNTYGPQQKEIVRTYAAALLPAEE